MSNEYGLPEIPVEEIVLDSSIVSADIVGSGGDSVGTKGCSIGGQGHREACGIEQVQTEGVSVRPGDPDPQPPAVEPEPLDIPLDEHESVWTVDSGEGQNNMPKMEFAVVKPIAWVLVGLICFWVYIQLAPLLRFVFECTGWRFYAAIVVVTIPIASVVWALVYVWKKWCKLPQFDQKRFGDESDTSLYQSLLSDYLKEIEDVPTYVEKCGFEDSELACKRLERLKKGYLEYGGTRNWLDDFGRFLDEQAICAKGAVIHYCKLIGLKTAICPWKIIDVVCVLVNTSLMVGKIATIYNRRLSGIAAARLVIHWCVNIYISGELGAVTEGTAAAVGEKVKDTVSDTNLFGEGGLAAMIGQSLPMFTKILTKWLGKVVEGSMNAYLAYRLGMRAIKEFKPIK